MAEVYAVISSASGLHARPASLFVEAVNSCGLEVTITPEGGEGVDAGSILGIMSLGLEKGAKVKLEAEGEGAQEKLQRLADLLETDLDA